MKMRQWLSALSILTLAACSSGNGGTTGGNPYSEDDSASGAVAQALGGALSSTSTGGLQAYFKARAPETAVAGLFDFSFLPKANAAGLCPTFHSAGPLCTASGSEMKLTYLDCSFGSSPVNWRGRQALTMSSGTAACGTFPNPGANGSLYRQFVNTAGTAPGAMLLTSSFGTEAEIDHASANLNNFDFVAIPAISNGGYGMQIDFNGTGARSAITFAERVAVVGKYDHTITGSVTISETAGADSRTVNGSVTVYMNHMHVVATSTITNLAHNDVCCQPVSGTISTSFAAGSSVTPTTLGALLVGHSETLEITGCGTANLTASDLTVHAVKLSRCF